MKQVLVCGAGGFIGGHLTAELIRQGHRVRAVDVKPLEEWHQRFDEAESLRLDEPRPVLAGEHAAVRAAELGRRAKHGDGSRHLGLASRRVGLREVGRVAEHRNPQPPRRSVLPDAGERRALERAEKGGMQLDAVDVELCGQIDPLRQRHAPGSERVEEAFREDGQPRGGRCAVGVWIDAGSRYEELKESGATYLLQRLAMRGTKNRTGDQIADTIDALGGKVDYETERDYACWRALVDGSDAASALELLADLALNPLIVSASKSAEQASLLEELRAADKEADLNLDRMFLRSLWKGHGLCRPPRGRLLIVKGKARLEDFKPKALSRFHEPIQLARAQRA